MLEFKSSFEIVNHQNSKQNKKFLKTGPRQDCRTVTNRVRPPPLPSALTALSAVAPRFRLSVHLKLFLSKAHHSASCFNKYVTIRTKRWVDLDIQDSYFSSACRKEKQTTFIKLRFGKTAESSVIQQLRQRSLPGRSLLIYLTQQQISQSGNIIWDKTWALWSEEKCSNKPAELLFMRREGTSLDIKYIL